MLAKVYGNYESITTDMIDIVELQTMYCRQEIAMNNTRAREEYKVIIQMALENKAIVSFRTRTSIQLESFGLEPNAVYILTRVLPYENSPIVEFLEMDGEKWIGKYGKIRSQWRGMSSFIAEHELVLHGEFR